VAKQQHRRGPHQEREEPELVPRHISVLHYFSQKASPGAQAHSKQAYAKWKRHPSYCDSNLRREIKNLISLASYFVLTSVHCTINIVCEMRVSAGIRYKWAQSTWRMRPCETPLHAKSVYGKAPYIQRVKADAMPKVNLFDANLHRDNTDEVFRHMNSITQTRPSDI
jgi:hypothetical protein